MSTLLDEPNIQTSFSPVSPVLSPAPSKKISVVRNILTVDVEEWFHVTNFAPYFRVEDWDHCDFRIQESLPLLLDVIAQYNAKATFFVLGWIAERHPFLIKRIANEGHEIATHGQNHQVVTKQSPDEFLKQLIESRDILEQLTGQPVKGHRAPSYSLNRETPWAVERLLEAGMQYDSSVFPFGFRRDSEWCEERFPCWMFNSEFGSLAQYPLTTFRLLGHNLPIAGGGYFRLLPYGLIRWGIASLNRMGHGANMYIHPWELDPGQPRMKQASRLAQFRHYYGLEHTKTKLERLLSEFRFFSFRDVYWSDWTSRYEIHPQY